MGWTDKVSKEVQELRKKGLTNFQIDRKLKLGKKFPRGTCDGCKHYSYLDWLENRWLCEHCYNKHLKEKQSHFNPSLRVSK